MAEGKGLGRALARRMGQEKMPEIKEKHRTGTSLLMNRNRLALFLQACKIPGTTLRDMARAAELSPGPAKKHLDLMEKAGLLAAQRDGGKTRYRCPALLTEEDFNAIALLAEEDVRKIFLLASAKPVRLMDVSELQGCSLQLAKYKLQKMKDAGLVRRDEMLYVANQKPEALKKQLIAKAPENTQKLLTLLHEQNLSPSKTRRYKNRLRVEVTMGKTRENITIYLIPQTLT